eukprot:2714407-Amphidinium_carterae.1
MYCQSSLNLAWSFLLSVSRLLSSSDSLVVCMESLQRRHKHGEVQQEFRRMLFYERLYDVLERHRAA